MCVSEKRQDKKLEITLERGIITLTTKLKIAHENSADIIAVLGNAPLVFVFLRSLTPFQRGHFLPVFPA